MSYYAGIDVSLECSSVCVVDANGKILREARVASEPAALIAWFLSSGFELERIGLEAGPLSQWLFAAMKAAGLAVELLETRHVRKAFEAMPVKSDRNDARGIAQSMRLGWFRPVHCKSMDAQEVRATLTDADRQARWHEQGQGGTRPPARGDHAPHARQRNPLQRRCRSSLTRSSATVFGQVTTPGLLEAKSLRRDDGSGQTVAHQVAS